jgi:DNA mismatch endonuclease (patch repair protein)
MDARMTTKKRRRPKRRPLDRSQIMARIRGKDTAPEMLLRRALRDRGIGYRLHAPDLPGRPDVVFRGARLAVFVHGCFWHRHPGCAKATDPKTSSPFWQEKFSRNVARDRRKADQLTARGWEVGVLWECEASRADDLSLAVDAIAERVRPCP